MGSKLVRQVRSGTGKTALPTKPALLESLHRILSHFARRLRATPLLTGWLLAGLGVAFFLDRWTGLVFGLINLVLIGIYAVLIRLMTPKPAVPVTVKRPRLELALAAGLLGLFLVIQLLDFGVWKAQPLQGWVRGFFVDVELWVYSTSGIPGWARQDIFIAASSTLKQLLPTVFIFCFLGYQRRGMGLTQPDWKLTTTLVGLTTVFGLLTGFLTRAPLGQVLGLYLIGIFVNALPEELFFRGFLLPRLEKVLTNRLNALVLSALLFNALHVPLEIANGAPPLVALLGIFSTAYPSGLIWGYLYLRTRSILPGVWWHAANGSLGFILMSF